MEYRFYNLMIYFNKYLQKQNLKRLKSYKVLFVDGCQMFANKFGHIECQNFVLPKNFGHFLVRCEELTIFGIFQIVFLEVCKKKFHQFSPTASSCFIVFISNRIQGKKGT